MRKDESVRIMTSEPIDFGAREGATEVELRVAVLKLGAGGEGRVTSAGAKPISIVRDGHEAVTSSRRAVPTWFASSIESTPTGGGTAPCHGSRSAIDGSVIGWTAVEDLERHEIERS